jgi:RNA polymerase sigma-70 factor (ECF subfamily)
MNRHDDGMPEVLREMCGGSAEAFDRFYARYAPLVMQIAWRTLGERMEAEDVCHDVFIEVLRRGGTYDRARGSLEAWLAVMTRSRCMDRLRRSRRLQAGGVEEERPADASDVPEERVVSQLQREAVRAALNTLPVNQRQAVVHSYFGAQTQREMSSAWNVPLGTVKSWIRYGLNNLRKQLEKQGWVRDMEDGAKEVQR